MRLPASKVYRAFPELDRFSDEQCERFLMAAKRGKWRVAWRLSLQILASAAAIAAVFGVMYGIACWTDERGRGSIRGSMMSDGMVALSLTLELCAAGLAWLLAKDWLLRRRIRRVINTRGSCATCGYVLAGLPVGADRNVTCPECGFKVLADAALGEVASDASGAERFLPSADVVPALSRWLTARRKKWIVRLAIWVPVGAVIVLGMGWGGYEWFLYSQAQRARAARTGVAGLVEFVEKHQEPGVTGDSPEAWAALDRVWQLIARTDIKVMREGTVEYPPTLRPDFSEVYSPSEDASNEEQARTTAMARELAVALIDAYRGAGVYGAMDEMAVCRRVVRRFGAPDLGGDPMSMMMPELGSMRNLARICAARMKLAADAGDVREFTSAFEGCLALGRVMKHGPLLVERLVANAITALAQARACEVLGAWPGRGREWVDAIQGAIDRQRDEVPFSVAFQGEEIMMLETAAWLFSEQSRVRGGRFSATVRQLSGDDLRKPLGTFEENVAAIQDAYREAIEIVTKEPWQRGREWGMREPGLVLVEDLMGSRRRSINAADQELVIERGLTVLLALERYRCERGEYPDALEGLVPGELAVMPLDPWTGAPFKYRRLPGTDGGKGWFLLHSVGADGVDNEGISSKNNATALWYGSSGFDYVIGPARLIPLTR